MDFSLPAGVSTDLIQYREVINTHVKPRLSAWNKNREIARDLFQTLGAGGWYGLKASNGDLARGSALREAVLAEEISKTSPGVAVAILAHIDLGLSGLYHLYCIKSLRRALVPIPPNLQSPPFLSHLYEKSLEAETSGCY